MAPPPAFLVGVLLPARVTIAFTLGLRFPLRRIAAE
jgi:hypothetical protein